MGQSPLRASQAVIVQEMIETRSAGVLFSRDPSGRSDTMLINAAWGLGEGISQGELAGDLFWVRRSTGELIASETGRATHRIELAPKGMGTVEVPLPPEQRERPCLSAEELGRVAALARSLEEVTGRAQDVEFGFDRDGGLVVFQMRRIVPRRMSRHGDGRLAIASALARRRRASGPGDCSPRQPRRRGPSQRGSRIRLRPVSRRFSFSSTGAPARRVPPWTFRGRRAGTAATAPRGGEFSDNPSPGLVETAAPDQRDRRGRS
jgi:hypothetical protein